MDYSLAVARIQRFLEEEAVVWLSTVRPDGTPHIVPVWFWWDGTSLLVFSKPDAVKIRNLRAGSSVMLGVGDADEDFDIGLFQGRAEILDVPTAEILPAGHLEKYASQMAGIGLTAAEYAETYPLVVRITPDPLPRLARPVDPAERPGSRGPADDHRRAGHRPAEPARMAGRAAGPRPARLRGRTAPTRRRRGALTEALPSR